MPLAGYLEVAHLSIKDITRIFSKIKVDPTTECWVWTGDRLKKGYGQIRWKNRNELIHRLLYAFAVERLPRWTVRGSHAGIPELDHIVCDNKACCNPAHVKLVPARENGLRGSGVAAINSRKTHCPKGHGLPEGPNTSRGGRECTECTAEYRASEEYREWMKVYQHEWWRSRYYGPDREMVLKQGRDYMREWRRKRREARAQ